MRQIMQVQPHPQVGAPVATGIRTRGGITARPAGVHAAQAQHRPYVPFTGPGQPLGHHPARQQAPQAVPQHTPPAILRNQSVPVVRHSAPNIIQRGQRAPAPARVYQNHHSRP